MRWLYYDENNDENAAERKAVIKKIEAWWQAFEKKTDDLTSFFSRKSKWDIAGWVNSHLHAIDPKLMWDFGPGINDGHRMLISPLENNHLRPLLDQILSRAPQLDGWEFYGFLPPVSLREAERYVAAKSGGMFDDIVVDAKIGDCGLIDLSFRSPRASGDHTQVVGDAYVATESLLGEECLHKWIGETRTDDTSGLRSAVPFDELKARVDALIGSVRDQLPEDPWYMFSSEKYWNVLGLSPEGRRELEDTDCEEWPGRSDVVTGSSLYPDVWRAPYPKGSFYSERFSKCGETFCYLKMEGGLTSKLQEVEFRSRLSDAIDEALIPQKLGCSVGFASGLSYGYIDLALTSVGQALPILRDVLQKFDVPRKSWLLFFDSDLVEEWIGIWDDAPIPPCWPETEPALPYEAPPIRETKTGQPVTRNASVGPNAPCPCGSGKKYKKCCMRK